MRVVSTGHTSALAGAIRYEFTMQWRRWTMWLPVLAAAAIMLTFVSGSRITYYGAFSVPAAVGTFALLFNFITPLACGLVLADRLARDRQLQVDEVLESLPASRGPRVWGKALGAALATMVPWLLVEVTGFALLAVYKHAASALIVGLAAFLTINLPALLFTATLSVVLPAVLWTPAYRFLFVGLWFWAGLDPTRIPSPSSSLLAPTGAYAAAGLFGGQGAYAGTAGSLIAFGPLAPPPSVATGCISVVVILALAATILALGPALLRLQRRG
jgi:ABC-type transport system involved in multi-copper enzyme maturation permease subunit